MNQALAQYLFFNETLYRLEDEAKGLSAAPPKGEGLVAKLPKQAEETCNASAPPFEMKTKCLLVVSELTGHDKEFLGKVLSALGLSFSKVDLLVRRIHPDVAFRDLIYQYAVQHILFFGQRCGGEFLEKLNLKKYKVATLKGVRFLSADTLEEIGENKQNEKRLLWEALQEFYT